MNSAKVWLERIHSLKLHHKIKILNVCGGHERTITMSGLRAVLPQNIELIPGPGCPVCVCPEEDVFTAIHLALNENLILTTFGDMLRVPINAPRHAIRSLEAARAQGADVRALATPQAALKLALQQPQRQVVLFAVGFETTMAPIAALLLQGVPDNLKVLVSGRLTWPAVAMLLAADASGFDALIAPGHVATVMGAQEWEFVVTQHRKATAIAGFTPDSLLAAVYSVTRQIHTQRYFLDNCYPASVRPDGNSTAKRLLNQAFVVTDANWRGIGKIAKSGFSLASGLHNLDVNQVYPQYAVASATRNHGGQMPPGCDCAQVLLGKIYPNQCRLFNTACQPRHPVGPCMVSEEGACRIWWSGGFKTDV